MRTTSRGNYLDVCVLVYVCVCVLSINNHNRCNYDTYKRVQQIETTKRAQNSLNSYLFVHTNEKNF